MNLSSFVQTSRIRQEQAGYISNYTPSKETPVEMTSVVLGHPYTMLVSHQYSYISAPQAPLSPPVEEPSNCCLPSISNLFGQADTPTTQEQAQPSQTTTAASQYTPATVNQSRINLPPTPPMQPDSRFVWRQSPSASLVSQFSVIALSYYYPQSTINNVEPHAQHQVSHSVQQRVTIPFSTPAYSPTYTPSPQSISSYYPSPMQAPLRQHQRPLPRNFPPVIPVVNLKASSRTNPWQHHYYIPPSSQASFPQSQDRYICQTCNKAFSRPSSLRIHSHSHTGEKPFKCPHQGCEKAFSVRSNMKRHERGCHSF
jgi:uncharacterized Zn-finger protein